MERDGARGGDPTCRIIGLAMCVHRGLGLVLLESVYEQCLCYGLARAAIPFQRQLPLPIRCDTVHLDTGFMADIIADNPMILELEAMEQIPPIHEVRLMTAFALPTAGLAWS